MIEKKVRKKRIVLCYQAENYEVWYKRTDKRIVKPPKKR